MIVFAVVVLILFSCCQEGLVSLIYSCGFNVLLNTFRISVQAIPRAIIHIGPHKAASTYIQSELVSHAKELTNVNYYWPTKKDGSLMGTKEIANYAYAIRGVLKSPELVLATMHSFVQHSLHRKHNIIMSSEEFDEVNSTHVATLKKHLKGFNVTIVFVYREVLAQLISLHFELNRFEHEKVVNFSTSFSGYLFQKLGGVPLLFRPVDEVKLYADAFGVESIRIIDMLGVAAAKKDIAHVLMCEIGGVLCNLKASSQKNTQASPASHQSNSAYSLLPSQVFSFYKSYLERQHNGTCHICGSVWKEHTRFTARYKEHLKVHPPPETITSNLALLVPFSQQADATLRDTYGAAILYSNRTVNLKAMSNVQVQEVDPESFMMDLHWNQWIHSEFQLALAEKRLCDC